MIENWADFSRQRWRTLTPQQEVAVRAAFRDGASIRELARAYEVSIRTVYRTLRRASERFVSVEVEGYRATFVVDDDGPKQRTDWVSAA